MLALQLLETMGWDGFREHVTKICDFYRDRRDQMIKLADKHLTGTHYFFFCH